MKDNWIKPFQDKLNEYELDLPVATNRRRAGWILPSSIGIAAAGLLALLLLRPTGPTPVPQQTFLIAESRIDLPGNVPQHIPVISLPARSRTVQTIGLPATESLPEETEKVLVEEPQTKGEPMTTLPVEIVAEVTPTEPVSEALEDRRNEDQVRKAAPSARLQFNLLGMKADGLDFSGMLRLGGSSTSPGLVFNPRDDQLREEHCKLPFKAGLSLRFPLDKRFSLESGLDYSFHHAVASYRYWYHDTEFRMHYIGIPLKGIYSLTSWERLNLYVTAGGEIEWLLFGRAFYTVDGKNLSDFRLQQHPFLFSVSAGAGAEFKLNTRLGIYAEPGIAWYILPNDYLPNYYRGHPLTVDLHVGLRFQLGGV